MAKVITWYIKNMYYSRPSAGCWVQLIVFSEGGTIQTIRRTYYQKLREGKHSESLHWFMHTGREAQEIAAGWRSHSGESTVHYPGGEETSRWDRWADVNCLKDHHVCRKRPTVGPLSENYRAVLVFQGCSNGFTSWVAQTEICLTVLKTRSLRSRCWLGWLLMKAMRVSVVGLSPYFW